MKQGLTVGLAGLLVAAMVVIGLRGTGGDGGDDDTGGDSDIASDASADVGDDDGPDDGTAATDDGSSGDTGTTSGSADIGPIGPTSFDCPDRVRSSEIVFVYSVEKETVMDRVVAGYNRLGCGSVDGYELPSGIQMSRLAAGWPREDDDIPLPHLASPSTSLWAIEANAVAAADGVDVVVDLDDPASLGWAPLVVAMPASVQEEMAPDGVIGLDDLAARVDREVAGHPFVLRKSNPEVASTGLMALIAAYATGGDVETLDDDSLAADSATLELARDLEAATPVYGRTSLSVLEEMCALDNRGVSPAAAVSALLTEEQLVADYNRGTGDFGCENDGTPNERLVAVYLDSPTPVSEHPLLHIEGTWVDADERLLAETFIQYALAPETLDVVQAELGVRDEAGSFPLDDPDAVGLATTLDPAIFDQRPQPSPEAIAAIRADWHRARKPFHIHFLVDLSGSMGFAANVEGRESTRLDEVKAALNDFIDRLQGPNDAISITAFPAPQQGFPTQRRIDLTVPSGAAGQEVEAVVEAMQADGDTPLYDAIEETYRSLHASPDDEAITVLVVLTDGLNDDDPDNPREGWSAVEEEADAARGGAVAEQLGALAVGTPPEERVRIFTISYGPEAQAGDDILQNFAGRTFGRATQSTTSEITVILRSIISSL